MKPATVRVTKSLRWSGRREDSCIVGQLVIRDGNLVHGQLKDRGRKARPTQGGRESIQKKEKKEDQNCVRHGREAC